MYIYTHTCIYKVPADVRLIEVQSTALKVEQAALTGEAASVNKNAKYVAAAADEVLCVCMYRYRYMYMYIYIDTYIYIYIEI